MSIDYGFVGKDVTVSITASGIDLSSATEIEFVLRKTGLTDILLSKTDGAIVANSQTSATVIIPKTAVTVAGMYAIRLSVTELSGKERGLKLLDVTHLIFE